MPDAFQELHQALRCGAHERNERIRRFAENRSIGTGSVAAVEYSVTPLGASLEDKLRALVDWTTQHTDTMHDAQQAFDQRNTLPGDTLRHRLR